ncbi:MAG: hypothetical protein FJ276_24800 [Planctomycetes bacterium]|nr:hypothetical protein [Planctomycetota bacterium]
MGVSLSTWFRDYVYIPLGGSRKGKVRTYIAVCLTMVVSGLWHGAMWTFVIWGALHTAGYCATRQLEKSPFYRTCVPRLAKQAFAGTGESRPPHTLGSSPTASRALRPRCYPTTCTRTPATHWPTATGRWPAGCWRTRHSASLLRRRGVASSPRAPRCWAARRPPITTRGQRYSRPGPA